MCGIAGVASYSGRPLRDPTSPLAMRDLLAHRGPDAADGRDVPGASLQVRRLAVVDLAGGRQPFTSPDGAVTLVCNGEIYNAEELRKDPAALGYPFRSRCDVESVLPLYLRYGTTAIEMLEGMFALALWDQRHGRLLLARDRAGEKPLFYADCGGEIVFGSEPKALLAHPRVGRDLDPVAIATYLMLGYVLAPRTLHRDIRKLPPAHVLVADAHGVRLSPYWRPERRADDVTGVSSFAGATRRVRETLRRAVSRELMSDVPVGVFLSGGLDSSLLLALVAEHLQPEALITYTASFGDRSYDESRPAAAIAKHFGATHHDVACDRGALRRAFDVVTERIDEPLGDPALLPTFLLGEAARRDVKVVLSGEGADELFGGYPTYLGHQLARALERLPRGVRRLLAEAVAVLPSSPDKVTLEFLLKRFVAHAGSAPLERHLDWFGAVGQASLSAALGPEARDAGAQAREEALALGRSALAGRDVLDGLMRFDFLTYLPDDLLAKVDRATMLSSVEARAPFLDLHVLELALELPRAFKVRGLETKRVLREAARPLLPASVLRRRKRGFSVPTAAWINAELAPEVDRLLAEPRLAREGWLDAAFVRRLLDEHRAGRANHARALWPLVMFQRWQERWGSTGGRAS